MKKIIIFLFMIICSVGLFAQSVKVTGTVVDDTNSPLPGVNIVVTGSGQGVVTDFDGKYSISLPSNKSTLEFTFIGFQKQQLKLKPNQTVLNVTMVSESLVLDEFVVVGYGSQKKASIVGAVSNIKNEEIKTAAPANLTNAIAGRITGAIVRLGDGNIGGGTDRYSSNGELANAQIFIRGRATTNAAEPLILVDGIESSFANINPEDIAQFSVLKDASATAVYGVRGANGVILITTKDGQLGKPKVSFKAELRRHESLAFPEFLGAYDYATLYNEALKNAGTSPKYTNEDLEHWRTGDDPYGHPDVNWR
ncbi:carboxypeptidase-like regulatory domain-containing protein, partial [Macellibacteroides fermentans]|nr:carboxypeptidase-like regulatory domain-containing protein [Macellibacteroides fermentans]